MVPVAYRRWSFMRSCKCRALTGKSLLFWISVCLWEVFGYEKWSHMEVELCTKEPMNIHNTCGTQKQKYIYSIQ